MRIVLVAALVLAGCVENEAAVAAETKPAEPAAPLFSDATVANAFAMFKPEHGTSFGEPKRTWKHPSSMRDSVIETFGDSNALTKAAITGEFPGGDHPHLTAADFKTFLRAFGAPYPDAVLRVIERGPVQLDSGLWAAWRSFGGTDLVQLAITDSAPEPDH